MDSETLSKVRVVRAIAWTTELVERMARDGKSANEIAGQLCHIEGAFQAWREGHRFLPSQEPPWLWNKAAWDKYITDSKANSWYPTEDYPHLDDIT